MVNGENDAPLRGPDMTPPPPAGAGPAEAPSGTAQGEPLPVAAHGASPSATAQEASPSATAQAAAPLAWAEGTAPFAAVRAPVRRRRRVRLAVAAAVAGVVAAGLFLVPGGTGPRATPAAAVASPSASPSPSPSPSRPPTTRETVDLTLAAQDKALLAGDLDGYLAPVDPALHGWFTARFTSLRTLGVALFSSRAADAPAVQPDGRFSLLLETSHCFGAVDCRTQQLFVDSTWTVAGGRAVLSAASRSTAPWDATELRFATGRRVVVAAPAKYASKLAATVKAADRGADVADRFAHWGQPPGRYVVYLAGPAEWRSWFDGRTENAADAFARGGEVVQRVDRGVGSYELFAHEFTHVVSLGKRVRGQQDWWLVEGLAEYAANRDGSWVRARLPFVRQYVRKGRWDGSVALGPIPERATDDDWQARYGIALLTVIRLAERFGEPAMLDFFAAVVRDGTPPDVAAPAALKTDWATVAADCAAYVRSRAK